MIAKDSLGFRPEDGGFVTKKEYLGYLHGQVGEEGAHKMSFAFTFTAVLTH